MTREKRKRNLPTATSQDGDGRQFLAETFSWGFIVGLPLALALEGLLEYLC